jgi:hypothetical protein
VALFRRPDLVFRNLAFFHFIRNEVKLLPWPILSNYSYISPRRNTFCYILSLGNYISSAPGIIVTPPWLVLLESGSGI